MSNRDNDKEDYKKALDYSLRLLAIKDRSELDIRQRLKQKGYNDKIVDIVIERLNIYGYLNEERLLGKLLRVALNERHYGRHSLKAFLISKGIRKELVSKLEIPEDDYIKSAHQFIKKKENNIKGHVDKRKIAQMLMRKGHDIETIKRVLNYGELDG